MVKKRLFLEKINKAIGEYSPEDYLISIDNHSIRIDALEVHQ
ncbi:hypothetical protein RO3G_11346 [Rhizopus delemar RA 99-880]|uniref:Uncharacterized protein n=1 Tax=Rhizopus delemar (strain RA 99-880 / ATCC MYA-4621 / FGSC 9543 / NRRL 43880) TaxID=246409 RepID=I1CDV5_RHIO9|nr:hypothetical protein RO3G_11346 [Rhizopus delemar RA 99-880]|eukprot:EIE86635.1 hypothetical protein RO3G_11346 [Rhizopus delemar RA 99-880]